MHKFFNVNKNPTDATICRYLFTAKLLFMFRVSQHPSSGVLKTVPAASGTGHTTCTATAGTVFNTPHDGCCDTRKMKSSFAVNKYLHTVASVGFLFTFNYDARNHELKKCTNSCFITRLWYAFTCFEHYVLIIRRSTLYYTASGIITLCRWPSGKPDGHLHSNPTTPKLQHTSKQKR